ncbi:TPA: 2Fe-2S ferredoxin [Candidatus Peribacteria bacterium]|nr:2Fe-2S ferredoxin [Candidatus Peribacteria bacterium]
MFLVPKVTFIYDGQTKEVEAKEDQTLLEAAIEAGVPMEHACGGNGFCTTCRCKVKKGSENLSARNDREENMGVSEEPDRLGCQAEVQGEVEVELAEE